LDELRPKKMMLDEEELLDETKSDHEDV